MLPRRRVPSALLLTQCAFALALAACASSVGPADAGDAARPSPSDSSADVASMPAPDAAPATDGGGGAPSQPITCPAHPEIAFPAAARACVAASDCVAVAHGLDCCGSRQYVGVNRAAQAAQFDPAEMQCRTAVHFDMCDCLAEPTFAEDGHTVPSPDRVAVDCRAGGCFAYVP